LLALAAAPARAADAPPAFGSQAVLDACWSAQELRGTPADREILRGKAAPPLAPIERERPKTVLPPLPGELRGSLRGVSPMGRRKVLALTFDLCETGGERPGYDERVVNYLRENRLHATFFAGGKWMRTHPDKAQQLMADPLFEIGNHAWTHGNLRKLHGGELARQVLRTQAQYELLREDLLKKPCAALSDTETSLIPKMLNLFRFPYGACDAEALEFLAGAGLAAVQWDVVPGDPSPAATAQAIADDILASARPGSIVVLHANGRGRHTAEALALAVPELLKRGYAFLTVSELLQTGPARAAAECYERRPGDNLRYDEPPKKEIPQKEIP
jgi:peptidoglycan/xylan/chitin deacetylase (PgdA/CDA1 family)